MTFQLVSLHRRLDLVDDCCNLLNTEWKRSFGVRSRFLLQSCDNLPTNLVLLRDDEVIGHIRLSGVVGEQNTLFVTSVIISPSCRGSGLGRKLIYLTEEYALRKGYNSMCLTSDEKERFYEKCGFARCDPVQQCQNKKLQDKLLSLKMEKDVDKSSRDQQTMTSTLISSESPAEVAPTSIIPPPPSVPLQKRTKEVANEPSYLVKIWMRKNLT